MTTLEVIATVASWNLGGVYTEENASQVQGRILSMINSGRLKILEMFYRDQMYVPQEYYQRFEVTDIWEDGCKGAFILNLSTTIATLPMPKRTGMDGIFPNCDASRPLTAVISERELSDYRRHTSMTAYAKNGIYVVTGKQIRGSVRGAEIPSKFLIRAIVSEPEKVASFNLEQDAYPAPDGFISDLKRLLTGDEGRKMMNFSDQVSNSKNDIEDANTAARR